MQVETALALGFQMEFLILSHDNDEWNMVYRAHEKEGFRLTLVGSHQ